MFLSLCSKVLDHSWHSAESTSSWKPLTRLSVNPLLWALSVFIVEVFISFYCDFLFTFVFSINCLEIRGCVSPSLYPQCLARQHKCLRNESVDGEDFLYYLLITIKGLTINVLVNQTPKHSIIFLFPLFSLCHISNKSIFKVSLNFLSSTKAFVPMPAVTRLQSINNHLNGIVTAGLSPPNQSHALLTVWFS